MRTANKRLFGLYFKKSMRQSLASLHRFVERKSWLSAMPVDKVINRTTIAAL
jgi:hypothetical protein